MRHCFRRHRSPTSVLAALASAALFSACINPLDVDTPRRQWVINIDSIAASDAFSKAPGDSMRAVVAGEEIEFATEVQRPTFHNGRFRNAEYVTVQASRQSLNGRDYEILSLRLDAVRDTGSFIINGAYSAPKNLDSLAPPTYAVQYERRLGGGFPETYRTGVEGSSGVIRVVRIDDDRGVMTGTFSFVAYSAERDTTISVGSGTFRVQLRR
jgi:hypothetical protein